MRTDQPATIYLKDYQPPAFKIPTTHLTFQVFDDYTDVHSVLELVREREENLVLLGERLKLLSIELNGKALSEGADYALTDVDLTIFNVPEAATLKISTRIDPANNTSLEGLYRSGTTYCTQCEPEGFRKITYYIDRPDNLSVFTTRIEGNWDKTPVLLSNGNLIEEGELEGDRHFTVWHDPFPKPSYLFALVAGDLVYIDDEFTTMTGRKVDLRIYVKDGDESQCGFAMDSLIRSMKWDEEVYGREYQLDRFNIVAVSDFNFGAMENTSLNIFNTALVLAHPDLATDNDFLNVEAVIAHEYFHNWSGNRVTCQNWFQLSLKEGLTVFRDQEFSADMHSAPVKRIEDVARLRRFQFAEDASPLAHPIRPDNYIEINNFYTTTVYEKGAEVIRMQRTLLGNDTYRKGTDLYFDRFDGQAVRCEDFVDCMEEASGQDLTKFELWYEQAGTPVVTAETAYDAEKRTYSITLSQMVPVTPGQSSKQPMVIPVAMSLLGPNGAPMALNADGVTEKVLRFEQAQQTFTFENIASKPVPSLLRNFSAPVRLKTDLSADDLRFLMVHDTDGFNRWESTQILAMQEFNRLLREGGDTCPVFIETYGTLLDQAVEEDQDRALIARMLNLPEIPLIAQEQAVVDPAAIYNVRQQVISDLAQEHADKFLRIYETMQQDGDYEVSSVAVATRALRNNALRYLMYSGEEDMLDLAYEHYASATNMTDRMAALNALADTTSEEREEVLEHFLNMYKDYPLVVDKWFAIQAAAVRPTTLEDVKRLAKHPEMNVKNPNRARSLYGVFAGNNPLYFHDQSGEGYRFLGDAVKQLNGINASVAARFCTPFREWKRYTEDRQAMMREQLEAILAEKDLSREVFEIASKSLAA